MTQTRDVIKIKDTQRKDADMDKMFEPTNSSGISLSCHFVCHSLAVFVATQDSVHTVEKLGEGTFAEVHKVQKAETSYAIKIAKGQKDCRLLQDEWSILAEFQTKNPHVIKTYELWPMESQPVALILEYCPYGSVRDFIKQSKSSSFPFTSRLALMDQFAIALTSVHRAGYVHRDLSPNNLLLRKIDPPELVLADFGLALPEKDALERNERVGTPKYMAPELFRDPIRPTGKAADVYAFGMVSFVIMAWRPIYKAYDKAKVREAVLKGVRGRIRKNWPPDIKNILKSSWKNDPEARPSIVDIATAIGLFRALDKKASMSTEIDQESVVNPSVR